MKMLKTIAPAVGIALFAAMAPRLSAYTWDDRSYITFTAPVELPGVALPAGTYLFQTADIWSNCDLIQVFSPDKSRIYATIQAMPAYRLEPAPRTIITFAERPANTPQALQFWFPRGLMYGHRFVYPPLRRPKPAQLVTRPEATNTSR